MFIYFIIITVLPFVHILTCLQVKSIFQNTASKVKPFKTFSLVGPTMCLEQCVRRSVCQAVQYDSQDLTCDLLSSNSPQDVVKKTGMALIDIRLWNGVSRYQSVRCPWSSVYITPHYKTTGRCVIEGQRSPVQSIARGKPTTSSSSLDTFSTSDKAVDGNYDAEFYHKTCIHTVNDKSTWTVDLQDIYTIEKVVIYNRNEGHYRLDFTYIEGYSVDPFFCNKGEICGYNPGPSGAVVTLTCPNITARFIQLRATYDHLIVCEVDVFGQLSFDQEDYPIFEWSTTKQKQGIKLNDDLVDVGSALSPIECHHLCQRRHLCTVFSYNNVTGACVTANKPLDKNSITSDVDWALYYYC